MLHQRDGSKNDDSGDDSRRRHRRRGDDDDDDDGDKNKRRPRAAAPPHSRTENGPSSAATAAPAACRRRSRSDLLLLAIGSCICLLSAIQLTLYAGFSLPGDSPAPNRRFRDLRRGRHERRAAGEEGGGPRPRLGDVGALRTRLDRFATGGGNAPKIPRPDESGNATGRAKENGGPGFAGGGRRKANVPWLDGFAEARRKDIVSAAVQRKIDKRTRDPPPARPDDRGAASMEDRGASAAVDEPIAPPSDGRVRPHPVADLDCSDHGGPTDRRVVDEMVFWSDVPADASYLSPMHPLVDPRTPDDVERFLTFEPDHGGWNNIRMAMETALVMSHAMGRTLVLPPEQRMYLLKGESFSFNDFFHLDAIAIEHRGFKVITMEEFLSRVAMEGELTDKAQKISYPSEKPNIFQEIKQGKLQNLFKYLRSVGNTPEWDPWECVLAIPSSTDPGSVVELNNTLHSIMDGSYGKPRPKLEEFNGNPVPVDAPLAERMREMLADRDNLCIYDEPLQRSKLIHLKVEKGVRLLTHFYAFVFFADWRQDLWSKRFVRDHLRYVDGIVCAAARVVGAVREHARKNGNHNASREEGTYDAMHVRRGDFQYPPTQLPAGELYNLSRGELTEGATLYVATDEKDKGFFDVFKEHYDVVFLADFISEVIPDVSPNYYGMIDQLVAYKSRVFYGTWWSTLSGYVNRMRGYYITKHKLEGHADGTMKSWYFTPEERVLQMRSYVPVRKPIYCREFPVSWRDIDRGMEETR